MQELVKHVSALEKELIKKGIQKEKINEIKNKLEKKHNVNEIRENPRSVGQDLVYYFDDLRKEFFNLLTKIWNKK